MCKWKIDDSASCVASWVVTGNLLGLSSLHHVRASEHLSKVR
jgi:hypothetical protein